MEYTHVHTKVSLFGVDECSCQHSHFSMLIQVRSLRLGNAAGFLFRPGFSPASPAAAAAALVGGLPAQRTASAGGNGSVSDGLPWFRLPSRLAPDMGWRADDTLGLDSQVPSPPTPPSPQPPSLHPSLNPEPPPFLPPSLLFPSSNDFVYLIAPQGGTKALFPNREGACPFPAYQNIQIRVSGLFYGVYGEFGH
jgi:hypothetical protein